MYILIILLIVSLSLGMFLVRFDDELCLFLKAVLLLCSLTFSVSLIKLIEHFDLLWVFYSLLIAGTIYLVPEYIEEYKRGKARRERIAKHKIDTTVHHFVTRDQGPE